MTIRKNLAGCKISLLVLLLGACQVHADLSENELKSYLLDPENNLLKTGTSGDYQIEVSYRPANLMVLQQTQDVSNAEEVDRIRQHFDTLSYFVIKLSRHGEELENNYSGDARRFSETISHLSSEMSQRIALTADGGPMAPMDVSYTQMFGGGRATALLAVFDIDLKSIQGNIKVVLEDPYLDLPKTEFEFDCADIKNIPNLKF